MKTLALTTALIAAIAAPTLVAANPVAQAIFAAEAASQQELVPTGSSSGGAAAAAIFLSEAASDDDRIGTSATVGNEVISTQSFGHNPVAARIFAAERAASLEDE